MEGVHDKEPLNLHKTLRANRKILNNMSSKLVFDSPEPLAHIGFELLQWAWKCETRRQVSTSLVQEKLMRGINRIGILGIISAITLLTVPTGAQPKSDPPTAVKHPLVVVMAQSRANSQKYLERDWVFSVGGIQRCRL